MPYDYLHDHFQASRGSLTTQPIVEFIVRNQRDSKTKIVSLPSRYDLYRNHTHGNTLIPPREWRRKDNGAFYHTRYPSTAFTFPLPSHDEMEQLQEDFTSPYLYFRAMRSHYIVSKYRMHASWLGLYDNHGTCVGGFQSHQRFPHGQQSLDTPRQFGVECIAIFELVIDASKSGWLQRCLDLSDQFRDGKFEFYNVLIIYWEDGVAYRDALGLIGKCAWEEANPEVIDIVLG